MSYLDLEKQVTLYKTVCISDVVEVEEMTRYEFHPYALKDLAWPSLQSNLELNKLLLKSQ